MWCGKPETSARWLEVGHIDGDETNTTKENLAWTCRPCNQRVAAHFKAMGAGRRTKQYNPAKRRPISDYREFINAVMITKGESIGNLDQAIESLKATGPRRRAEFQKELWERRKEIYGPSGRKDGGSVPF